MRGDVKLQEEMARIVEREGALSNRAAGFALLAALLALVTVVVMPIAFRETERVDLRVISATPLAGTAGAAAWAFAARRRLEAVRARKAELLSQPEAARVRGAEPPEAA